MTAIGAVVAGAAVVVTATHRPQAPHPVPGASKPVAVRPEAWTTDLAVDMDDDDTYRDPGDRDRDMAVTALGQLLAADRSVPAGIDGFRSLGFAAQQGTDAETGRQLVLLSCRAATCPGWGMLLVDTSAPVGLAIEVPHPKADLNTEKLGLDLFRRIPGAVLIMAGAHRRAADGSADVAHNASSMFNALAGWFADHDLPQVQLHGFADESLPGADVVVSTGQGTPSDAGERVGAAVAAGGLRACRAWRDSCGRLEGTTNAQGARAAEAESTFLHIEINYGIRGSAPRRKTLIDDLVAADLSERR